MKTAVSAPDEWAYQVARLVSLLKWTALLKQYALESNLWFFYNNQRPDWWAA